MRAKVIRFSPIKCGTNYTEKNVATFNVELMITLLTECSNLIFDKQSYDKRQVIV